MPPRMAFALTGLLLTSAAPTIRYGDGAWATFARGTTCDATSRAARVAADRAEQAYLAISFDRSGNRHGQLAAKLSRPLRPGATVMLSVANQPFLLAARDRFAWSRGPAQEAAIIAAMRSASSLRIEARSPAGGRFVDSYALDGAPGAIDAAAACAALS